MKVEERTLPCPPTITTFLDMLIREFVEYNLALKLLKYAAKYLPGVRMYGVRADRRLGLELGFEHRQVLMA